MHADREDLMAKDEGEQQAEVDALQRRVEELEARPERRRHRRAITATVLVVCAVLVFTAAVPGTWARRTLLDTDRYVATVAPLATDPAVQEYLARIVTAQVFDALDVQTRMSEFLREKAPNLVILAGPITNGLQGFVQDQLQKLFESDAFANIWASANRVVHAQLVAALNGDSEANGISLQNGQVVLNLLPMVNAALESMSQTVSDLVGRPVTLPTFTGDEIPTQAISELESALGITLPDDFGQIVVYDSQTLAQVQDGITFASNAIVALALLFIVLFALALWVSPHRRRTLLQVLTAIIVVLVIERRFAIAEANALTTKADPDNQNALRAVLDQVQGSLLRYTGWMLALALLVVVIALLSGPYPWAVRFRSWIAAIAAAAVGAVREHEPTGTVTWVVAHRDALMFAGAVVGILILLFADLSVGWFLVLTVVIVLYEVAIYRAGTPPEGSGPPAAPPSAPPA